MAEWARADRPPLRPDRRVSHATTRARSSSRWARSPTRRSPSSTICGPGPAGRLRRGHVVPAVPGRGARGALAGARAVGGRRADRRSARGGQPADARGQGRALRRGGRGRRWSRGSVSFSAGLGSRDVAAGDLVAVFDWLGRAWRAAERPSAVLGIRHPLALERDARRPPAGRRLHRCAATRSAGSGQRHDQQAAWRRSSASCSTSRSRRIRATARRRRACRRPTT